MRYLLVVVSVLQTHSELPGSLRQLKGIAWPSVWTEMNAFFSSSAAANFRIGIETSCVAQPLEPWRWRKPSIQKRRRAAPWWRPSEAVLTHPKWSAEVWLPLMLSRSRWAASNEEESNATLVMYRSRGNPRHALSWCQWLLKTSGKNVNNLWFPVISSRGPCCDGGQFRDPGLRRHHFISHNGEIPQGPWLFREARFADYQRRSSQYKAPVTTDTAPYLRCFDTAYDLTLAPPSLLLRKRSTHVQPTHQGRMRKCINSRYRDALNCYLSHDFQSATSKDILVAHAEGKAGGMEYHLRRTITELWDPNYYPSLSEIDRAARRNDGWTPWVIQNEHLRNTTRTIALTRKKQISIHFAMAFENYTNLMQRSRYCLVSEGYSPWSPRIAETIAHGCVPVIVSPSLQPPYADILDWSTFSIRLHPNDLPRLPYILGLDHAKLHANLIKIRPLFAFCIDAGGEDRQCGPLAGDALPLIIFDMARKTIKSKSIPTDRIIFSNDFKAPKLYSGIASQVLAGSPTHGQPPQRTDVHYACNLANGTCIYTLFDQTWLCSMANTLHCECALRTLENDWRFVGDVRNLIGHRTYLWKDGGISGPTARVPNSSSVERSQNVNIQALELLTLLATEQSKKLS